MLERCGFEAETVPDGSGPWSPTPGQGVRPALQGGVHGLTVKGGLGGKDAVRRIVELDPRARVIVSSGYSNDPVLSRYEEYGFCGC